MKEEDNILRWVLKKIQPQSADLSFFSFQLKTEADSASEELRVFNMGLSAMSSNLVSAVIPLWSSGQSFWLQIQRSRVRFPALPDFLSSSGSGTGSTQPREVN